jgi:hypothetical protein
MKCLGKWLNKEGRLDHHALILIPAYNEGERIGRVIREIKDIFPSIGILVIDDGSKDDTKLRALEAGAQVISHPFNLGYGTALQTGYRYALRKGCEEIAQMDGDGQHDPAFIETLLNTVRRGEGDIAVGSRFLTPGPTRPEYLPYRPPFLRKLGMIFFRTITSMIIRRKVTDPTSGYQAMNRKVLEWVSGEKFPTDYPDADVIIMLHRAGFRIKEVPVRMFPSKDKKSMHSGWKPVYYLFKMLLSILVTLMRK